MARPARPTTTGVTGARYRPGSWLLGAPGSAQGRAAVAVELLDPRVGLDARGRAAGDLGVALIRAGRGPRVRQPVALPASATGRVLALPGALAALKAGRQVPAGARCRGGPCLGATPDQARRLAAESAPPFRAGEAEPTRHAERLERRTNPRRVRRCTQARRVGDRMNPQQKESKRTRSPRRSWSLVERGRERTRAARAWPRSPPRFASQATAWPPADSRQHTSRSGSGSWQLIAA